MMRSTKSLMWSQKTRTAGVLALAAILCLPVTAYAQSAESGQGSGQEAGDQPDMGAAELRNAYQREYAFLSAQKRQLENRIREFRAQAESERQSLNRELEQLQASIIDLESQISALQSRIGEAERTAESARRNEDLLQSTFQQANATFSEYDQPAVENNEETATDEALGTLFERGVQMLRSRNELRTESGSFFTAAGDRVDGELIHLGGVASYGVSDSAAGILVPAGSGELKLWKDPRPGVARQIAEGELPAILPLYIYGSLSNQVAVDEDAGVIGTIQKGGVIAWLIMALASLALALIIARIVFLRRASNSTSEVADTIGEMVSSRRIDEAIEACRRASGSTAAVIAAALRNIHRDRESLDDIINEAILHESSHLERFGSFILVIAAVSPLLGLLGTVTGMISTFEVITEHGTGDPQLLSGGISVALITTELGLIVAIPTLLVGNMLSGWADRIKDDMQKAALRVTNHYERAIAARGA